MAAVETFRGHVKPDWCDHLGHMNLGRYLEVCGDGVFYLQSLVGLDPAEMVAGRGQSFAAVHAESQFLSEVRVGEAIRLTTGVIEIGTKSCTFDKRIFAGLEGRLAFQARIKSAFLNLATRRAVPLPDALREQLSGLSVGDEKGR